MAAKQTAVSAVPGRRWDSLQSDQFGLLQSAERLDHALKFVLGGAVAAVGVGVAALQQLGVAAADQRAVGGGVKVEICQRVALQPAQLFVERGPVGGSLLLLIAAEDAKRVAEEALRSLRGRL